MEKTYDLPKSLLLAESKLMIKAKGDPVVNYSDKVQTLCTAHDQRSRCQRVDCRYDHNLVDAARIERLVRWAPWGMSDYEALTIECEVSPGQVRWKIILKESAFAKLDETDPLARTIPPRPFSYENEDLLQVVKHMEGIVGLASTKFSYSQRR